MTTTSSRSPLASSSVHRHLLRGAVGLLAVVGAILLLGVVGPISLALLPVAAVAWRGCPTCWAVGLMGTLSECHSCGGDVDARVAVQRRDP